MIFEPNWRSTSCTLMIQRSLMIQCSLMIQRSLMIQCSLMIQRSLMS